MSCYEIQLNVSCLGGGVHNIRGVINGQCMLNVYKCLDFPLNNERVNTIYN